MDILNISIMFYNQINRFFLAYQYTLYYFHRYLYMFHNPYIPFHYYLFFR